MPYLPNKPCAWPGCGAVVKHQDRHCDKHKAKHHQSRDERRGSSTERGYNYRWQRARALYLEQHPLCVECEKAGKLAPASVVDHVIPHKGNNSLFWDENNWQALCKPCHDRKTATEDGGFGR